MHSRKPFKVKIISKRRSRSTDSNHYRYTSMSPREHYHTTSVSRYNRYSRNYSRSSRGSSYSSRSPSIQRGRSPTRRGSRNNRDHDEIEALSNVVSTLVEEVRSLKASQHFRPSQDEKEKSAEPSVRPTRRNVSVSPEPVTGYHRRARKLLEDMDEKQYKLFHDEVVQILNGLDDSLQLDPSKNWQQISSKVSKQTMKAIDKAMQGRFRYNDVELKWVLQQLHRHRRETWKVNLDPEKIKSEKRRKGINSRRGDKKERRQRGLSHMFNADDVSLKELQPSSLTWEDFRKDCEDLMNEGGFHSDEVSETDEELANTEIEECIRPKNKQDDDKHILRIYDKPWRSRRARKILRLADKVGENMSHVKTVRRRWYDDGKWKDRSKPPEQAPEWTVSQSYHPEETESQDDNRSRDTGGDGNNADLFVLDANV